MKYSPRGRLELARRRHPGVTSGPWLVSEGGSRQVTVANALPSLHISVPASLRDGK